MKTRRTRKADNVIAPEIIITNAVGAAAEVLKDRGKWFVLSIRDPEDKGQLAPVDAFKDLTLGVQPLYFHDVDDRHLANPTHRGKPLVFPELVDVKTGLEWAKGKNPVLVHCAAGISRSSAFAYLIGCLSGQPEEALNVLDARLHWPNKRIVRLGAEYMGKPEILTTYQKWRETHARIFGI